MKGKNKVLIILAVLMIAASVFACISIHQKNLIDSFAVVYLSNVYAYIDTQLLPLPDDLTPEEWDAKISYLQIAGNMLAPGSNKYGQYGKVCEVIQRLSGIEHNNYNAALALTRTLKINCNTYDNRVEIISGDIDKVIEVLSVL